MALLLHLPPHSTARKHKMCAYTQIRPARGHAAQWGGGGTLAASSRAFLFRLFSSFIVLFSRAVFFVSEKKNARNRVCSHLPIDSGGGRTRQAPAECARLIDIRPSCVVGPKGGRPLGGPFSGAGRTGRFSKNVQRVA
jgi:hypothetical protein